jgi:hypothetical protein
LKRRQKKSKAEGIVTVVTKTNQDSKGSQTRSLKMRARLPEKAAHTRTSNRPD